MTIPQTEMDGTSPILHNKDASRPSVFTPDALLREARRQKGIAFKAIPRVCILDPDGDIVRRLRKDGRSTSFHGWPCYHTELDVFELAGIAGLPLAS